MLTRSRQTVLPFAIPGRRWRVGQQAGDVFDTGGAFDGLTLTIELRSAAEARDVVGALTAAQPRAADIARHVADHFAVPLCDLLGRSWAEGAHDRRVIAHNLASFLSGRSDAVVAPALGTTASTLQRSRRTLRLWQATSDPRLTMLEDAARHVRAALERETTG